MKRAALITFVLFLTAIIYSSCTENVYMDWKLMNDRWYSTLEDSLKLDTLFHKTSSGIYYKRLGQGGQRFPNPQDVVYITRKGTLVDGSTFTSGNDTVYLATLTKGEQEIIRKMQNGGHYIFYVPSKLGHDTVSTDVSIPPYSVLKFDIVLTKSY